MAVSSTPKEVSTTPGVNLQYVLGLNDKGSLSPTGVSAGATGNSAF